MTKWIAVLLTLLLFGVVSQSSARVVEQTWTGEIGDNACKFEHLPIVENDPVLPAPECVKICVRGGSTYVFIVGETLYRIENQKHPDLEKFAGRKVKLTGELAGNVITISRLVAADE
jgi:hypothetical protein